MKLKTFELERAGFTMDEVSRARQRLEGENTRRGGGGGGGGHGGCEEVVKFGKFWEVELPEQKLRDVVMFEYV